MNLEREIIQGKFDVIDRNLRFLEEIKTLNPDQFVESYRDIQAAKYSLLEIIEACVEELAAMVTQRRFQDYISARVC